MEIREYSRDKVKSIGLLLFGVISSEILLLPFEIIPYVRIYVGIVPILLFGICFFSEYFQKKKFYESLNQKLEELEEKYLIVELIDNLNFTEAKIWKEVLQQTEKSMQEKVSYYKSLQEDYKEYIELWIHEVKMPIATSKMIVENNKTQATLSIEEELDKIENYIEQALFYARSNTVEKDYYIRKVKLKEIVNATIVKNKRSFIQNKVKVEIEPIEKTVYTDSKWCIFIINQILQNAIKYSKEEQKEIRIEAEEQKEKVILWITDNGIGIPQKEITRVFEKGFTGEKGRKNGHKSTGIGLYLCKKLANKLGIGLNLDSKEGVGTQVKIVFPKGSFTQEVIEKGTENKKKNKVDG